MRGGAARAWGSWRGQSTRALQIKGWACGVGLKFPITSDGSGVPREASETQVQANLPSLFPIPPLVSLGS